MPHIARVALPMAFAVALRADTHSNSMTTEAGIVNLGADAHSVHRVVGSPGPYTSSIVDPSADLNFFEQAGNWSILNPTNANLTVQNKLIVSDETYPTRDFMLHHGNSSIAAFPVPAFTPVGADENLALDLFPTDVGGPFIGQISGNTLTVTSMGSFAGALQVSDLLYGHGIPPGTAITAFLTGSGRTGTYAINKSLTIASEEIGSSPPDYGGNGVTWNDVCDTSTNGFTQCLHLSMGGTYATVGVNNYGPSGAKPLKIIVNGMSELTFNTNGVPSIDKQGSGTVLNVGSANSVGNSTATPDAIDLGNDYSSTNGENPKFLLYHDGYGNQFGMGASSDGVDFIGTPSGNAFYNFWAGPSLGFSLTPTQLEVNWTTASTSITTGAIVNAGGMGLAGNLFVGAQINSTATTSSVSPNTGAIVTAGGIGVAGSANIGGPLLVGGTTSLKLSSGTMAIKGLGAPVLNANGEGAIYLSETEGAHYSGQGSMIDASLVGTAGIALAVPHDTQTVRLTPVSISSLPICNSGMSGALAFVSDVSAASTPIWHGSVSGLGSTRVQSLVSCNGSYWQYE